MKNASARAALLGFAAMSLGGCVIDINDDDSGSDLVEAVPPPPVPMMCDAAPAQAYAGREATQSLGEAILRATGSRTLRWGAPDTAWTRDYRQDRVNVRYNARMVILEITCG